MDITVPGYRLVDGPPTLTNYLELRHRSGLSPKTWAQASAALPGSWAACHVVEHGSGQSVAMGRVIGDGGWYFHIIDMAVLPEHQRRGLGDAFMKVLLGRIRGQAPPGANVNLLADAAGRALYRRHGFTYTAPNSLGMKLTLT